MILKKLQIQNFKSFGNNINEFEFNLTKGELILLTAPNGHGKSSIQESIDFALFGKVKGKSKKTIKLTSLPNRYNNNLMVSLDFESFGKDVNVVRKINPSKLDVNIEGEFVKRAGKANVQAKLDEYVDFDLDSWKSFISMSINDFKNFMTLTPEEKRLLLDRLFNLEMINNVTKILKEKKKQYKSQIDIFNTEIRSYESSLNEFKKSIDKLKIAKEDNIEAEKAEIKESMLSKKEEFGSLKEKIEKCTNKETEFRNLVSEKQTEFTKVKFQIEETQKKINLFNSGVCPTCGSDLSVETHNSYRNELNDTLESLTALKEEIKKEGGEAKTKLDKLLKISKETNQLFSELKIYLKNLKSRLEQLNNKEDVDEDETCDTINSLNESIQTIEERKTESSDNLLGVKSEDSTLDQLLKVFSNDGIKKSIISKIVVPINHFIRENLEQMNVEFTVELDDQFSAKLYLLGQEIDVESISTGETKKVNIAIMLAYLKLIRMKRHINLLFLDEVFSSIDIDGIYSILKMLRKFANDYNINIFLVHHAMLESSYFDRVIRVEKNITSNIIEEEKSEQVTDNEFNG
jgi:DNA repair exonuclease SbcCD ATPase subunit